MSRKAMRGWLLRFPYHKKPGFIQPLIEGVRQDLQFSGSRPGLLDLSKSNFYPLSFAHRGPYECFMFADRKVFLGGARNNGVEGNEKCRSSREN